MKKIRYTLLYPEADDTSLVKDVGMIPDTLAQDFGYDAALICYEKIKFRDDKKKNPGAKVICLKPFYRNALLDGMRFIRKNAKEIDILQLFHPVKRNVIWILCYKMWNPGGKVYLKLDADHRIITSVRGKHDIFHRLKKKMIEWLLMSPDLVTVESTDMRKQIEDYYGIKIPVLPNGYQDREETADSYRKEKIILTVARNGTYQKATENLLAAFAAADIGAEWKLRLVGSMEESFCTYYHQFMEEHKELEGKITYAGEIHERRALYEEYERASVFALPSRYESFGIVLAEALSRGCYLVTTDSVPSAHDLIPDNRYGEIVETDNISSLAETFERIDRKPEIIDAYQKDRSEHARERFTWYGICRQLEEYLNA